AGWILSHIRGLKRRKGNLIFNCFLPFWRTLTTPRIKWQSTTGATTTLNIGYAESEKMLPDKVDPSTWECATVKTGCFSRLPSGRNGTNLQSIKYNNRERYLVFGYRSAGLFLAFFDVETSLKSFLRSLCCPSSSLQQQPEVVQQFNNRIHLPLILALIFGSPYPPAAD
ncbi:hypothetical protein I7I51_03831, partial [Histoplasma capsulatum]